MAITDASAVYTIIQMCDMISVLTTWQYYNVVYGNYWLGKHPEGRDTPRYLTAHIEDEQAAMFFHHGGQKISCVVSHISLSFFLDFVWESNEEKIRTVEVAYTSIAFHLKMVNILHAWMWSNKYAQAKHFDRPALQWCRRTKTGFMLFQIPERNYRYFLTAIVLSFYMGQNWAIINCSISAHYGYFKSLPIFLNTHKNNYNMYFSPATRCRWLFF